MANVLVSGGAGFIGSNLVEALLKRGHHVRVLDNFSTGKKENLLLDKNYPNLEIINGDICDLSICQKAVREIDFVFHHAALPSVQRSVEDPLLTNAVNAEGTLNLLIVSRDNGVKRFIYASSSSIYGDTPTLPKREDMPPNPQSPYALQKYIGEKYCHLFYQLFGLETISLRYFNIFGPKQDPESIYSAVIPRFISAMIEKRPPVIYGDGEQSRDFTYIDNVVQANILAMEKDHLHGEIVNIGCGEMISLNHLLEILYKIFGYKISPIYEEPRKGDVRQSLADINKGKELLNYEPMVRIEDGLRKTVEYFKRQFKNRED